MLSVLTLACMYVVLIHIRACTFSIRDSDQFLLNSILLGLKERPALLYRELIWIEFVMRNYWILSERAIRLWSLYILEKIL
jgi:hypothetical protein